MKGRTVEKQYRRVTDLDEKIKNVSLPYFQWKVLFLVLEETNIDELVKALSSDDKSVQEALDSLEKNGILESVSADTDIPEDIVEDKKEEVKLVEEETEESEKEEEEVAAEIVSETEEEIEEKISEEAEAPIAELLDDDTDEEPLEKESEQLSEELVEEPEEEIKIEEIEEDTEEVKLETLEEALEETEEEDSKEEEDSEDVSSFIDEIGSDEKVAEEKQVPEPKEESADEKKDKLSADAKTIMVIDDSIVIRKMVEIALEDGDYNIVTSNSGKDGLKLLDEENPDLVIVDMTLPDMNGIDLLKTVKASKGIPVIMLSGKDAPQLVESAKNEGADDFLPKPFRDDDLIEKVKNLLK